MRLLASNIPAEEVAQWDVRDANTGARVMGVNWADDETHELEVCGCAYGCRMKNGFPGCENGKVYRLPRIVILFSRKLILVNVREEWRDDSLFGTGVSEDERRAREAAWDNAMNPR
jgi:hypothetical protein